MRRMSHSFFLKNKKQSVFHYRLFTGIFCLLLLACNQGTEKSDTTLLNQSYPPQAGGTLIGAMPSDPSSMIGMVAGFAC